MTVPLRLISGILARTLLIYTGMIVVMAGVALVLSGMFGLARPTMVLSLGIRGRRRWC